MGKATVSASELLVQSIVAGLQDKKGEDIVSLDLRELKNTFADFMVISSAGNSRQLEALIDNVEDFARKQLNERPFMREGINDVTEWALLDYVNVVVHIFIKDKREFYALEELWGDAKLISYPG